MLELDYKESWAPKNWCFWTVVLEKTLESPLDSKEIKPVHPKGDQSWIFIGRTDAEAEAPISWPPDAKNWLLRKDPDAGKDWRWEEKGITEDEMVGWHHPLDGNEFKWAPGVGDGQESLACYSPWGCKDLGMTKRLNWTEVKTICLCHLSPHYSPIVNSMLKKDSREKQRVIIAEIYIKYSALKSVPVPSLYRLHSWLRGKFL